MTHKLLFSDRALPLILEAFGKSISEDGLIVESNGEPVLTPDGEEIRAHDFGGIRGGAFLKDDLYSIITFAV